MVDKRKQVYLVKNGSADAAFEIRETPIPSVSNNEALVRVNSSGLNFADVMARKGLYREAPDLPCVLGYEVAGVVESCPDKRELEGKRVLAFTRFQGYSEYLNVRLDAIVEIGEIDFKSATALATQFVTAWYASQYITNLHKGEKVLIHAAAGGVGTALVQMAKNKGCEVFALTSKKEKFEILKELGADHIINYRENDYIEEIKTILKGSRINVSFNPVAGASFKNDKSLIGSGGRIILFGGSDRTDGKWGIFSTLNFVRKMGLIVPIGLMMRSRSILGVNMLKVADYYPEIIQTGLQTVIKDVQQGNLKPIHFKDFNYQDISQAHDLLESGNSIGKISISWE